MRQSITTTTSETKRRRRNTKRTMATYHVDNNIKPKQTIEYAFHRQYVQDKNPSAKESTTTTRRNNSYSTRRTTRLSARTAATKQSSNDDMEEVGMLGSGVTVLVPKFASRNKQPLIALYLARKLILVGIDELIQLEGKEMALKSELSTI